MRKFKPGDIVYHNYSKRVGTITQLNSVFDVQVWTSYGQEVWQIVRIRYYYIQSNYSIRLNGKTYYGGSVNVLDKEWQNGEIFIGKKKTATN